MTEIELRAELEQTKRLLEQEKGKRIAVEREIAETRRNAERTLQQARALEEETQRAMEQASEQMKIALCVSQGVWALGHMQRQYLIRKIAAARVVHRENRMCELMEQSINAQTVGDKTALQSASDKMAKVIKTIREDGEQARLQAAEVMLAYGVQSFEEIFDRLVQGEASSPESA